MRRADLFAILRRDIPVHAWLRRERQALGPLRHRLLHELETRPGSAIGELANAAGRSRSTVSQAVAGLAERQLVNIYDDDADRRRHLVELSPDGAAYLADSRRGGQEAARDAQRKLAELEADVKPIELLAAEAAIELYWHGPRSQSALADSLGVRHEGLVAALSMLASRRMVCVGEARTTPRVHTLTAVGCAKVEQIFLREALRHRPEGAAAGRPWQENATPQACGGPVAAEVLAAIPEAKGKSVAELSRQLSLAPALVHAALDTLAARGLANGPPGRSGDSRWVVLLPPGRALLGAEDADQQDRQAALRSLRVHIADGNPRLEAALAAYAAHVMYFSPAEADPVLDRTLALPSAAAQAAVSLLRRARYTFTVGSRVGLSDGGVRVVEATYVRSWLHGRGSA